MIELGIETTARGTAIRGAKESVALGKMEKRAGAPSCPAQDPM